MSENQVLENTQTQPKSPPAPVVYADLLSRFRQNSNVGHNTLNDVDAKDVDAKNAKDVEQVNQTQKNESNKNKRGFTPRQNGQKPRQNGQDKQYTQKDTQQKQPRLSQKDYLYELKNCQKSFFLHLEEYLKQEVLDKSKTNDDKKEVKVIKKTNLQRIQNGSPGVNVMRLFLDKTENSQQKYITELKYLDNLVTNRQMNFVETLSNYMDKYGVVTSFKGKNNIMIHSPYLVV